MSETLINQDFIGKLEATRVNRELRPMPDITGLTLGGFRTRSRLSVSSGEADIYLCQGADGQECILKLYRRENALTPEVVSRLQEIRSPYVAPVYHFGEHNGHQYIVRPFYRYSNLAGVLRDGKRFTAEELRTLIIPSLTEGLATVHRAGILHRDLKPANMIPDDTGSRIVLIDFGISAAPGDKSLVVSGTGMTPCYASPEAMRGVYLRETDYYALGISLYELYTGRTPFQDTVNAPGELPILSLVNRIEFPENFPEDLRELVLGLTYMDLTHRNEPDNPNRRWGDPEIRRWLSGERQPVPGEHAPGPVPRDFLPYVFRGRSCLSLKDLCREFLGDPGAGVRELGRGILAHHLGLTSPEKAALCQNAQDSLGTDEAANREILKRLVYTLVPDLEELFLGGRAFSGIPELGRALVSAALEEKVSREESGHTTSPGTGESPDRGERASLPEDFRDFITGSLAEVFFSRGSSGGKLRALVSRLKTLVPEENLSSADTALLFGYAVSDSRELCLGGVRYPNPVAAAGALLALRERDPESGLREISRLEPELNFYERAFPDPESREAISRILAEIRRAVFRLPGSDSEEFRFQGPEELERFIAEASQEDRPRIVRRLCETYGAALRDVSEKVWKSAVFERLKERMRHMIGIGEYLFDTEERFQAFLEDLMLKGTANPRYLRDFVCCHREALNALSEQAEGERLRDLVREVIGAGDSVILLDYYAFPDLKHLLEFLAEMKDRESTRPGIMRDFARAHATTLKNLGSIPELAAPVREFLDAGTAPEVPGEILINTVRYPLMSPGDTVVMGSFRQEPGDISRPLEWLVIKRAGERALLISKYGLEARPYHDFVRDITWEECSLRAWLNGEFFRESFSEEERKLVCLTRLENPDRADLGISGGGVTADRIFCLSIAEVRECLRDRNLRICRPTPRVLESRICRTGLNGASFWWLRSPGGMQCRAAGIGENGALCAGGNYADYREGLVRPAMWVAVK